VWRYIQLLALFVLGFNEIMGLSLKCSMKFCEERMVRAGSE
jgi:hypothetical protein